VASVPGAAKLQLYKNNVEARVLLRNQRNYLMSRQTPFSAVIAGLTPFWCRGRSSPVPAGWVGAVG